MPPRLRASDYAKGKISQDEIIALQIANDANISRARKAIKLGEIPQRTEMETASTMDLLLDDATQEATARTNVMKLGFKDREAAVIITNIREEASLDFATFNANFPAIEADVRKRFNVKLITPTFFIEYLKKYSDELADANGVKSVFNVNNMGVNNLVNTIAELRQVIPDPNVIEYIKRAAKESRVIGQETLNQLEYLKDLLPDAKALQVIATLDPVRQQRIIDQLLVQFADMPSEADIRGLASKIEADQIDRASFQKEILELINSIPRGRQENIVEQEIGSSSSFVPIDAEPSEQDRKSAKDILNYERDKKAAQNIIDIKGDPRILTPAQKLIYSKLTGITRFAPTKEEISSITGDRASVSGQTLNSAISLDTATLTQIKATFRANPDLAALLRNADGEQFNYNDLQLSEPAKPGRKVWIQDTNIRAIFQTKFGRGLNSIVKKTIQPIIKLKVGRGLAVKETPSYREYGKYAIHIPQLEQQDILNVKYKSLGQIPKFKPIPVSDIFRDFILDLIENGKPNARVYTQISPDERKFFEEMSIGAGIWNSLGLKRTTTSTDEEENKRFELLKGEYVAGNNSPKVISELRKLVVKMMSDGRIRKNQGVELLMELSL
jgi:hypothetical protein